MPGSIFKTVVGLAALEAGLDPKEINQVPNNPAEPNKGAIRVGNRTFKDTAPPGRLRFPPRAEAFQQFLFHHRRLANRSGTGLSGWASRFHFGERIGLPIRQEDRRHFSRPAAPQTRLDRRQDRATCASARTRCW